MNILQELERAGAIMLGEHFVYSSGKHGSGYINMDPLFPDTQLVVSICAQLIQPFKGCFDTVASPATGGVVLAFASAMQAQDPRPVAIWADKVSGGHFAFERAGFTDHLDGKKVLVVEDLLTTGGSVAKVCRKAKEHGAEIIGVSVICNRGGVTAAQLGVPRLEALASVDFEAVEPDQCDLCQTRVPIVTNIGHGGEYQTKHPDYPGGYVQHTTKVA